MFTITDGELLKRALNTIIAPQIKRLLMERRDQLGGDIVGVARFLVAEPLDGLDALETALGFPIRGDPEDSLGCEWLADHGTFFEAVWILTDEGFAHVALIPKHDGIDPELLKLCESDPV